MCEGLAVGEVTGQRAGTLRAHVLKRLCAGLNLGVEQLGKAGIVGHVLEVGVGACLDAVVRVQADRLGQLFETGVRIASHAGEHGQTIECIVGLVVRGDDPFQLAARVFVVAVIQQRYGVVVLLFGRGKFCSALLFAACC